MNFDVANKLNEHLMQIVHHANEALFMANNSQDEILKQAAQSALGAAIAEIDVNLWELIYVQHPGLRPPGMVAMNQSSPE